MLGVYVLRPTIEAYTGKGISAFYVSIITFFVGLIVLPLCYEFMHLLGAKVGGYKVYSFDVFYFNFYKDGEGKNKFRFKSFDGLTGETKVAPRERPNGKICNPKPMLFFPNLFLSAFLIVSIFMYLFFNAQTSPFKAVFCILMILSALFLFYNILPIELDAKTDGYQLKLIGKETDVAIYNELLRLQECEFYGIDKGEVKVFTDNMSDFAAQIDLMTIYKYISEEKYYEARKIIDAILAQKDKIHYNIGIELLAQKLFIYLYTGAISDAKEFYNNSMTAEEKRDISNSDSLVCIRTYILVSTFLDPSESEIQYATEKADKAYKRINSSYKEIEKKLYKNTLKIAQDAHPTWVLVESNVEEKKPEENKNEEK